MLGVLKPTCTRGALVHAHEYNRTVVFMGEHMGFPCTHLYFDLVKPKTTTVD